MERLNEAANLVRAAVNDIPEPARTIKFTAIVESKCSGLLEPNFFHAQGGSVFRNSKNPESPPASSTKA